MNDESEFGPWQLHDGKGCPCVGKMVQVVFVNFVECVGIAGKYGGRSWMWTGLDQDGWHDDGDARFMPIIRYRIRKPRALLDMIQLIADLPAPVAPIKTDGVIA